MEWKGRRESENIEDRRMLTPGRAAVGGGFGILVIALITYLLGGDPQQILNQIQNNPQQGVAEKAGPPDPAQDELKHFVAVVLADTEDVWRASSSARWARRTRSRAWCCSAVGSSRGAAWPAPPSGRSTVRATNRFISISRSSTNSRTAFARRVRPGVCHRP